MFSWFKKKPQRSAAEEAAHQKGKEAATAFTESFDAYFAQRFDPVLADYLNVLRDGLRDTLTNVSAPPIILARVEYSNFLAETTLLKEKVLEEIAVAMARWFEVADAMGTREEFQRYIDYRVNDKMNLLPMEGLSVLTQAVSYLKPADDEYRARYPDKSKEFPPPA